MSFPEVLAASGSMGLVVGVCWPAWHVALEPAQLLAGIVSYPHATPFQLYETRVWNVWHQVLAPFLAAGIAERELSIALSGVVVALAFSAVAGFALAQGAGAALALGSPFLVWLLGFLEQGFGYPILFIGYGHTYGMAGLSWLALTCAVLAAERPRAVGFLVGFGPAVHASLGAWLAVVLGIAALWNRAAVRPHLRSFGGGLALGATLSAASLATHWGSFPAPPAIDPAVANLYLDAFVDQWDAHRVPAAVDGWIGLMVALSMLVALVRLGYSRAGLGTGADLSLRVLVVCGGIGFATSVMQRILPVQAIPSPLLIAMPGRLANLVILLYAPLMIALLWRFRGDLLARVLLLALGVASLVALRTIGLRTLGLPLLGIGTLVVVARNAERPGAFRLGLAGLLAWVALRFLWRIRDYRIWGVPGVDRVLGVAAALVVLAFALERAGLLVGVGRASHDLAQRPAVRWLQELWRRGARHSRLLDGTIAAAFLGIVLLMLKVTLPGAWARMEAMGDWTNRPALARAKGDPGILLVAPGLPRVQLLTRRPVLLDPTALDMLPYVLPAGPELSEILREVYGINFFHPPWQAIHNARMPEELVRTLWEGRTPKEWEAIGARFEVSEALVRSDWKLELPELARGDGYALYQLPKPAR
jgi:hypothetical protein